MSNSVVKVFVTRLKHNLSIAARTRIRRTVHVDNRCLDTGEYWWWTCQNSDYRNHRFYIGATERQFIKLSE